MKKSLVTIALMSAFGLTQVNICNHSKKENKSFPPSNPKKIIPRGCNEYNFTKSGTMVSESCTYIYYSCVASSEKKAVEKYKKFYSQNNPNKK